MLVAGSKLEAKYKKRVIVDTDMGWDDVLSILYLIKNPEIEIIGIMVTGCGETDLRWGTIIAKTLMELGGLTQAKICKGAEHSLKYNHYFPRSFKDDMNDIMGLLGSLNPDINIEIDPRPAWEFMANISNQSHEDIEILSLGGFTNIAKMLQLYPEVATEKIKNIYAMAGAIYVDGNVDLLNNAKPDWDQGPIYSTNHYAEWNVFIDPLAAKIVFGSEIPLTLIPLDACNYVLLNSDYVDRITATDEIATLARNIIIKKTGESNEGIPVPIFDPLATVIMADGLKNYQSHEEYLDVNIEEIKSDNHCGKTYIVDSGKRKIRIVQGVSQHEFAEHFIEVINGKWQNTIIEN